MSGSMTVTPAANWADWESGGNVPPPTAPQISDNPAQDATPGSSILQRAMAMLKGTGGTGAVTPALGGADASAPGAAMPLDTPVPPIPPQTPPPPAGNNAPLQPGGPPGTGGPGGLPMAPVGTQPVSTPVQIPPQAVAPAAPSAAPVAPVAVSQAAQPAPNAPGDPTKVYSMVVPGESGGNSGAVNKISGAVGSAQFLPSTRDDFLASSANTKPGGGQWTASDFTDPQNGPAVSQQATTWLAGVNNGIFQSTLGRPATQPELVAAHMLGGTAAAALAAQPTMPMIAALSKVMSPTKAAQIAGANPGVYSPNMTGAQALTAIPAYYAGRPVVSGSSVTPSGTPPVPAPTTGQPPSTQTNDLVNMLTQIKGVQTPLPYPDAGKAPGGSQMLALAAGLLSGHSPADAFSKGLSGLNNANLEQQKVQGQNNQEQAQLNQQQSSLAQQAIAHQEMMKIMNGRLDNQTKTTDFRTDPAAQAAVAAAKTQGSTEATQTVKDNFEQIKEIDDQGAAANQHIPAMQNLLQQIDTSGAGPSVVSGFKRQLATAFGMKIGDTDPTSVQLVNAYNAMDQSQAAQAMKGLGLRTQNEFGTFIKGVGSIDASPAVMKQLVGMQLQGSQAAAQAYSDYHAMAPSDKAAMMTSPSGVSGFRAKYIQGAGAAQGVQVGPVGTGTVGAPAAPVTGRQKVIAGTTYTQASDGSWHSQ